MKSLKLAVNLILFAMFAGCAFIGQYIPALAPHYPTGANLSTRPADAPLFSAHPLGAKLMAAPIPVAYTIPASLLMPVIYQQAEDCGPCDLAAIAFPATGQQLSPRATYVWSRQLASPSNWTADGGTNAVDNMQVAKSQGQPRASVWAYAGNINALPTAPAVADAAAYELTPVLTPTLAAVEASVAANHPCCTFIYCTSTEWYNPTKCADGSWEVKTPTATSVHIGGHFPTIVGYDNARKCLDGTTGALFVQNSWGTGWAGNGFAWISVNGWFTNNGDAGSRFTLLPKTAPPPPPPPPPPPVPPLPPIPAGPQPRIALFEAVTSAGLPIAATVAPGTPLELYCVAAPGSPRLLIQPSTGGNPIVVTGTATPIAPTVTTTYTLTAQTTGGVAAKTITVSVK